MVTTESADTFADGLATRIPAEMTQALINQKVDEIVTVSEEEMAHGDSTASVSHAQLGRRRRSSLARCCAESTRSARWTTGRDHSERREY